MRFSWLTSNSVSQAKRLTSLPIGPLRDRDIYSGRAENPNLLLKQIKKLRQQLSEIKEVILKERWHMQCIFQDLM